jgi:hypothetical protein
VNFVQALFGQLFNVSNDGRVRNGEPGMRQDFHLFFRRARAKKEETGNQLEIIRFLGP